MATACETLRTEEIERPLPQANIAHLRHHPSKVMGCSGQRRRHSSYIRSAAHVSINAAPHEDTQRVHGRPAPCRSEAHPSIQQDYAVGACDLSFLFLNGVPVVPELNLCQRQHCLQLGRNSTESVNTSRRGYQQDPACQPHPSIPPHTKQKGYPAFLQEARIFIRTTEDGEGFWIRWTSGHADG